MECAVKSILDLLSAIMDAACVDDDTKTRAGYLYARLRLRVMELS
jgi:hypothetical protein